MDTNLLSSTLLYFEVAVTFHATESDVRYYYKVGAFNATDAKKNAISRAAGELAVKGSRSIGNGLYEVAVIFRKYTDSPKYTITSAKTAEQAGVLALNEARKNFDATIVFYEGEKT